MYIEVVSRSARIALLTALIPFGWSGTTTSGATLAWNASTSPNITAYTVRYGTSPGNHPNSLNAGTALSLALPVLALGPTYYFVVTARNSSGQESDPSNEISYTPTVAPPNILPTLDAIANRTINEDAGQQTVALSGITAGLGDLLQLLSVTASSNNPGLVPAPTVTYTSPNPTGTLRFTPVANANGSAVITVTVNDGGLLNNLFSRTFTVTVNPVNDAPTLNALNNLSLNAGAGAQTVSLAGITSGVANESQTLTVTASSSNPGLIPTPTVTYVSPNPTGTLRITPVPGATGSATITVSVNDGQSQNNLVSRTFTVTVSGSLNTPPTLNPLNNLVLNEDAGPQTVNLSGITPGAVGETQTLTVTANSSNPSLIPNPTVTYASPSSTGTLRLTPATNANGTATITVTVNDGQSQNNLISRGFLVTINAVNDAPTLNALNNLALPVSAGQQTVLLSGITAGAANENQPLAVTAVSSNPGLVPNPTITYTSPGSTGSLRFTPVNGASGTATITVTVNDGQAQNNIFRRSFNVVVATTANTPPTLNPLANVTYYPGVGQRIVSLSGITSGSPNENQPLTVTATSSNPSLIPNPVVSYSSPGSVGTLRFTPPPNATGTATITVTVNDGQAQNNTISRSFTVTISPPPSLFIYLRAEAGTLVAPMTAVVPTNGSGSRYVYSPVDNQGTVSIPFNVPVAGTYWVWCRVLSPDTGTDSFFVAADGGTEEIYITALNSWSPSWQWTRLNGHLTGGERTFNWSPGTHSLRFRAREKFTLLEALYITNDRNLIPH